MIVWPTYRPTLLKSKEVVKLIIPYLKMAKINRLSTHVNIEQLPLCVRRFTEEMNILEYIAFHYYIEIIKIYQEINYG